MYRDVINTLAFILGMILVLAASAASAEPATEETVHQLTEFVAVTALAISFCIGTVFGHQR